MKKIALLASLVLALSLPSLAQMAGQTGRPGTPGTPGGTDTPGATVPGATSRMPGTSGTSNSQMQNDTKSNKKMGKKMTATGCISEKDGKYMLMNSQHRDGMELMTSENLKTHVGHTVKVTGMMENGSSMSRSSNMAEASRSDATKSGSTMNSGSSTMHHDSMSMMSMKMTSMKMVSDSCSSMDKSTK